MKALAAIFLASTLLGTTSSETKLDDCIVPPGDGILATVLVEALEAARPLLVTGIPSLGIPPIDPFGPIPKVNFNIDAPGLRMEGAVDQTVIKNLADFIICSLNISVLLTSKFAVEFRLDNWHMEGQYEVDGLIASLFPVFGSGNYRLDTYDSGFYGAAVVTYNVFQDRARIKDLSFDVYFNRLEMEMECILGCGDMSELINGVVSQIAPPLFDAVWGAVEPSLSSYLQSGLNEILKNISISDIITPDYYPDLKELGNANDFVDTLMPVLNAAIVASDLDPAPLPDASFTLLGASVELHGGEVTGLSDMYRSGTCTLDKVASWVFLYANLGDEHLQVHYEANITSATSSSFVTITGSVHDVGVYAVARKDVFGLVTDIDQFVVDDFDTIHIDIEGLGLLGYLMEPLTDAVINLLSEDLANILETNIKDLLQDILGETPWPPY